MSQIAGIRVVFNLNHQSLILAPKAYDDDITCNIFQAFFLDHFDVNLLMYCAYNNNEALDRHLNAHIHCKNAFAKKYEEFVTN